MIREREREKLIKRKEEKRKERCKKTRVKKNEETLNFFQKDLKETFFENSLPYKLKKKITTILEHLSISLKYVHQSTTMQHMEKNTYPKIKDKIESMEKDSPSTFPRIFSTIAKSETKLGAWIYSNTRRTFLARPSNEISYRGWLISGLRTTF